jgi:hypothetical protein
VNSDIHTLSLSPEHASALRQALRKGLPSEIHLVVTSGMTPEHKTDKLESLVYDFHTLEGVLAWTPDDQEKGRALRQLNTEGVMRLREVAMSAMPEGEELQPGIVGAMAVITRALSAPLDSSRLAFPIGSMENPRVMA